MTRMGFSGRAPGLPKIQYHGTPSHMVTTKKKLLLSVGGLLPR